MPAASCEMGSGAHSPQLRLEAPTDDAVWDGYAVCLTAAPINDMVVGADHETSVQVSFNSHNTNDDDQTSYTPTPTEWPRLVVPEFAWYYTMGLRLQFKLEDVDYSGLPNGHLDIYCETTGGIIGACGSLALPAGLSPESMADWCLATAPTCAAANLCPNDGAAEFVPVLFTAGNGTNNITVNSGTLKSQWFSGAGSQVGFFEVCQDIDVLYGDPGGTMDETIVNLEVDGCGQIASTWQEVADAINADTPINATIIQNGSDVVELDPNEFDSSGSFLCCILGGGGPPSGPITISARIGASV